jgi:hypothetical protein
VASDGSRQVNKRRDVDGSRVELGRKSVELSLESKGGVDGLAGNGVEGRREGGVHAGGGGAAAGGAHDVRHRGNGEVHVEGGVGREVGGGLLDNALEEANAVTKLAVLLVEVTGLGGVHHENRASLGHHRRRAGGDDGLDVLGHVGRGRCDGGEGDAAASRDNLRRNAEVRSERDNRVSRGRFASLRGRGRCAARAESLVLSLELKHTLLKPCKVSLALVAGTLGGFAVADRLKVRW